MVIYLYCLTEPGCEPPAGLCGIAGEMVRSVGGAGRLAAWVSDLPEDPGPATAELVRLHDNVVRAALALETPLPARFGQSFAGDRALTRALEPRIERLERLLERVRGAVEMTVRILLPGAPAYGAAPGVVSGVVPPAATTAELDQVSSTRKPGSKFRPGNMDPRLRGDDATTGRAYMTRLRERRQASAELRKEAEFLQARVARAVDEFAREGVCSPVMPEAHSFSLSHLVARGAVSEYRLAVDALVKSDPALRLLVSGPWAPYSFARIASE